MEDVMVLNALDKEVHVQAFGNHFSFKAGQIKRMRREIADFLCRERKNMGLVGLPAEFEEPEYKLTEDGVKILEEKKLEGVRNRIAHLQWQVNNLKSLQRDLEMKNLKVDPLTMASDGDIQAMEELHQYQNKAQDNDKKRLDRIRELERKLKASSNALANYSKPRPETEKEDD